MNKLAKKLKMKNTHFSNPHGLNNRYNTSTCEDLNILTIKATQNLLFKEIIK